MTSLETVYIVAPRALDMARRLEFAMAQLKAGHNRTGVTVLVRERFGCSQPTAWRVVDMAFDLIGEI